jgi:hypothetical protein
MKREAFAITAITTIIALCAVIFLDYNVYQEVFVATGVTLSFWGIVLMVLFAGPGTIIGLKLLSLVITLPFMISNKLLWIAIGVLILEGALKVIEKSIKE